MNNKQTKKQMTARKVGFTERFTPECVESGLFGMPLTISRSQIEAWLAGMNAAKRLSDEQACREELARTIEAKAGTSRCDVPARVERAEPFAATRPNTPVAPAVRARTAVSATLAKSAVPAMVARRYQAAGLGWYAKLGAIVCTLCVLCLLCGFGERTARCSEIIRGYAPQDGQQLYAADLDNLVDESTIGVQFYNDQQTTPVLGSGYYFLLLNPANQTYYRMNAGQVLYGNTNMFLYPTPEPVPAYGLMLFCDPTNGWVASTTVSNFLWNSASNINVAGLSFANTNDSTATYQYALPVWPYPLSGLPPNGTNYPASLMIFGTNGVPYREGLSNWEWNVASDMGNCFSVPWEYQQEFYPWQIYGTNSVSPYTNAFGWYTNFPITAYLEPNNGNTLTNATLEDNDTIPVNAHQEGVATTGNATNTSATLFSIYEYMTNKNALPPYTLARTEFSGYTASASITNMSNVTGIITNVALATSWTNPTPVSFQGASTMMPTVPGVISNVVYWAQVTNWPNLGFQLFTNFANAEARINPIQGNGVNPVNASTLFYLTNYTAVNCVVIQESATASKITGLYGIWFTNFVPQNPYYYLTGSVLDGGTTGNGGGYLSISGTQPPATNTVNVETWVNNTSPNQFSQDEVLIQPQ